MVDKIENFIVYYLQNNKHYVHMEEPKQLNIESTQHGYWKKVPFKVKIDPFLEHFEKMPIIWDLEKEINGYCMSVICFDGKGNKLKKEQFELESNVYFRKNHVKLFRPKISKKNVNGKKIDVQIIILKDNEPEYVSNKCEINFKKSMKSRDEFKYCLVKKNDNEHTLQKRVVDFIEIDPKKIKTEYDVMNEWNVDQVSEWIFGIIGSKYQNIFMENAVNGKSLFLLNENDFKDLIQAIGPRSILREGLRKIRS